MIDPIIEIQSKRSQSKINRRVLFEHHSKVLPENEDWYFPSLGDGPRWTGTGSTMRRPRNIVEEAIEQLLVYFRFRDPKGNRRKQPDFRHDRYFLEIQTKSVTRIKVFLPLPYKNPFVF